MAANSSIPNTNDGADGAKEIASFETRVARWVMLVDDDPTMGDMYRLGLEHYGFRVTVVRDAAELFGAIDTQVPDVLVLDWALPGLTGDEILKLVRKDARTRKLPVFMLSEDPDVDSKAIDRVFRWGVLAWLEKAKTAPLELAQKVSEALRSPALS